MGFNHTDNLLLPKQKWVKITDQSGLLHFKFDTNNIIYIYEGSADPTVEIPSPDIAQPVMVLNAGNNSQANKMGHTYVYKNRLGSLWAYSENKDSYCLKMIGSCGTCN